MVKRDARKTKVKFKADDSTGPNEDPFLWDDSGGSPFDWLEFRKPGRQQAILRNKLRDPWHFTDSAGDLDALTERRRRKLQNLAVNVEVEEYDEGEFVA